MRVSLTILLIFVFGMGCGKSSSLLETTKKTYDTMQDPTRNDLGRHVIDLANGGVFDCTAVSIDGYDFYQTGKRLFNINPSDPNLTSFFESFQLYIDSSCQIEFGIVEREGSGNLSKSDHLLYVNQVFGKMMVDTEQYSVLMRGAAFCGRNDWFEGVWRMLSTCL